MNFKLADEVSIGLYQEWNEHADLREANTHSQ